MRGQLDLGEPAPAALAEHVGHRRRRSDCGSGPRGPGCAAACADATRLERCAIRRRNARVISSGAHTSGRSPPRRAAPAPCASTLSVLTFADAIALRAHRIRHRHPARVLAPAARRSPTSSPSTPTPRDRPAPATPRTRPAGSSRSARAAAASPSSMTATSAKRLCTSSATVLITRPPPRHRRDHFAGRPGNTTPTDPRSTGATGQVEGATRYQRAQTPTCAAACPQPVFPAAPVPVWTTSPAETAALFIAVVLQAQAALRLARGVRDARRGPRRDRRLRRPLPPPAPPRLAYRTPREVAATWKDHDDQSIPAA